MTEREQIAVGLCCFVAGSIDQRASLHWGWSMRGMICTTDWGNNTRSQHDEDGILRVVPRG